MTKTNHKMLSLALWLSLACGAVFTLATCNEAHAQVSPCPRAGESKPGCLSKTDVRNVAVDAGAGDGAGVDKCFLTATMSTAQASDIGEDDHIKFNTTEASNGSCITFDSSTAYTKANGVASIGRFTLSGSGTKKYRLTFTLGFATFSGAALLQMAIVKASDGSRLSGGIGPTSTYAASNGYGALVLETVVAISSSTVYDVRIMSVASLTSLGGTSTGGGDAGVFNIGPRLHIQEL
jgi:hypothetical protein